VNQPSVNDVISMLFPMHQVAQILHAYN